jgi:hypothetical protein
MTFKVHTYKNHWPQDSAPVWIGFITDDASPTFWPIRFSGATEGEVIKKAEAFYATDREKREAAKAARADAAAKRAKGKQEAA